MQVPGHGQLLANLPNRPRSVKRRPLFAHFCSLTERTASDWRQLLQNVYPPKNSENALGQTAAAADGIRLTPERYANGRQHIG